MIYRLQPPLAVLCFVSVSAIPPAWGDFLFYEKRNVKKHRQYNQITILF